MMRELLYGTLSLRPPLPTRRSRSGGDPPCAFFGVTGTALDVETDSASRSGSAASERPDGHGTSLARRPLQWWM